jgi:hypothetical protein
MKIYSKRREIKARPGLVVVRRTAFEVRRHLWQPLY